MIRGAVYRVDLGSARGHEQGGRRFGLVLSPSRMNWPVATIVPTFTSAGPATFRPTFTIAGRETRLLVDQIRTVDTDYLVGEPVDYLHHDQLVLVEEAVGYYLGLVP